MIGRNLGLEIFYSFSSGSSREDKLRQLIIFLNDIGAMELVRNMG